MPHFLESIKNQARGLDLIFGRGEQATWHTLSYADPATYADWGALPRPQVCRLTKLGNALHELRSITDCPRRGWLGTVGDGRTGAARRLRAIDMYLGDP